MLTLICGADRLETSCVLLERLCARAKADRGGNILIVPEQYSHETERALCRAGGDSISRYAEVLSFTRLASRVAAVCGGVCEEYLDEGGRILTVYLAAQQVLPELKHYAAAAVRPAFLQQLAAIVEEFLSYCVEPQALLDAAKRAEGQFAQKLRELGLLYESYLSICKTGRSDPATRLFQLNDRLFEHPYAADKTFYLDGFSDFTAAQMQILTTLLPQADVVAALATDGSDLPVFATASETARLLKKHAAALGVAVRTEHLTASAARAADTQAWLEGLFARNAEQYAEDAPHLALHSAATRAEECEFAAAYVQRHVRGGGRYRDVTIAVSDPAAYLPLLRSVFGRAGIPAFFSGTMPVVQHPVTAALRAALHAAERYEYEPVMQYLKSPLSPLTREAADRLEQYAYRWNLHGSAWEQPLQFHPGGYGAPWTEDDRAALAQLELWRAAAIAPVQTLRGALRRAGCLAESVEAVAQFLTQTGLAETLAGQAEQLHAAGQSQQAQQTEQLYEYLLQALEQIWQIAGRQSMPQEQFLQLLELLLGCYSIGSIPAKADEVQIGPLPAMRHRQTGRFLLLGAEEGKFPSFQTPDGLLSDEERKQLLSLGLSLAPSQETRLERELGWIYTALSAATGQVVLSTGGGQASYLLERTRLLFPAARVLRGEDYAYIPDAGAAAAAYVRAEQTEALALHPVLLQAARDLTAHSRYTFAPLRQESVRGLYGGRVQLSASRIDQFSACKYAFFLRYGLKSESWKQAKFDAPMFGTFVHYVLEQTVRDTMAQGGFHTVPEETVMETVDRHIQGYAEAFLPDLAARGARFSYLFARSRREVRDIAADVARELRRSDFVPADTELEFAAKGALPPVEAAGRLGSSVISGFVDRVDLFETEQAAYYRVVDYKTGSKDFDYASILQGEGLQMLIYLFALKKYGPARYGKPLIPAGVLYVPSRSAMERIAPGEDAAQAQALRQKKTRRKGLVLADEDVLQAMERGETTEYLPAQRKKGEWCGDLATREQFSEMEQFVGMSLAELTDTLLAGVVAPDPLGRGPKLPCDYCEYQAACHRDLGGQARRYTSAIGAEQFWESVERRISHGGDADEGTAGGR